MKNSEVGALIPLSPGSQDDVMSEDSMSIKSFGEDQDYASALSSITATPQPPPMNPYSQGLSYHHNRHQNSAVSSVASAGNFSCKKNFFVKSLSALLNHSVAI